MSGEKCECRCHTHPKGHYHCWTGPCCQELNIPIEDLKIPYVPRKPRDTTPIGEFKTFIFPQIKQKWPELIAKDIIDSK